MCLFVVIVMYQVYILLYICSLGNSRIDQTCDQIKALASVTYLGPYIYPRFQNRKGGVLINRVGMVIVYKTIKSQSAQFADNWLMENPYWEVL